MYEKKNILHNYMRWRVLQDENLILSEQEITDNPPLSI